MTGKKALNRADSQQRFRAEVEAAYSKAGNFQKAFTASATNCLSDYPTDGVADREFRQRMARGYNRSQGLLSEK